MQLFRNSSMHIKNYVLYCADNKSLNKELMQGQEEILKIWTPSLLKLKPLQAPTSLMLWWVYCLKSILLKNPAYKIFYREKDNRIVHYTIACGKCFKFPFLRGGDIQIGPSWTEEKYRNRNMATDSIIEIAEYYEGIANRYFWISRKENNASRRLVEKVGFTNYGDIKKKKVIGIIAIYRI